MFAMNQVIGKLSKRAAQVLLIALLLPYTLTVWGQSANWSPLLEADTLAALIDSDKRVSIIQVTGDAQAGIIPGSRYIPYSSFRGPANNAGQLPTIAVLQAVLQQTGIRADTPVVVVHQGASASDFGAATRVYWTLKSLGVQQLAVLNGGLQAWQLAGLPLVTGDNSVSQAPAGTDLTGESLFQPQWHNQWRMTAEEVERSIGNNQITLLDSRPLSFYLGEQAVAVRPGTIRSADNLSFDTWFDGNRLRPVPELALLLEHHMPSPGATTVTFCNTGHWASINWFVLSELLQVPDTRMYAESVVEWARLGSPMDNQPGRLAWYWGLTRDWLQQMTGR